MTKIRPFLLAALAISALLTQPACRMFQGSSAPNPEKMARVARDATYGGTVLWLQGAPEWGMKAHPEDRPKFVRAQQELRALTSNTNAFTVADLTRILSQLPIRELQGNGPRIVIGIALMVWDDYNVEIGKLDTNSVFEVYVRPVALGILEGLDRGLAAPAGTKVDLSHRYKMASIRRRE